MAQAGIRSPVQTCNPFNVRAQIVVGGLTSHLVSARNSFNQEALQRLVQKIADRDHDAFASLYILTSEVLLTLLCRRLVNTHHAEDVRNDVYLQVWRSAHSYDPARGPEMAWIMNIARTRSIDHIRARPRTFFQLTSEIPDPTDDGYFEDVLRCRVYLDKPMRTLSAEQQLLLKLAFLDGRSHSEIAEYLGGVPMGTIKTPIRQTLVALRAVHVSTRPKVL